MDTSLAALLFRPDEVSDRLLSHAFAVALAGWDAPAPHLLVSPLSLPGWSVAFYRSGGAVREEEFEHACELFEVELAPGLCVQAAAADAGKPSARTYAITLTEAFVHDDAWCFAEEGATRRFVRDGDEGIEAGVVSADASEVFPVEVEAPAGASEAEEDAAVERAIAAHRGSELLAIELGGPVRAALMAALWSPERRLEIRLVEPGAPAIVDEVRGLLRALGRREGRGAFAPDTSAPESYAAFVRTYDWEDPADPSDLYRELSIGRIEGTLAFLRAADLAALESDATLFPIASLRPSAPGAPAEARRLVALASDGDRLRILDRGGRSEEAGPTFGELLRYLALGWKRRTDWEAEVIAALMLRARLRATGTGA